MVHNENPNNVKHFVFKDEDRFHHQLRHQVSHGAELRGGGLAYDYSR